MNVDTVCYVITIKLGTNFDTVCYVITIKLDTNFDTFCYVITIDFVQTFTQSVKFAQSFVVMTKQTVSSLHQV
jgi:hypothetical protein